jgi:AcrR family transcriptional regulator
VSKRLEQTARRAEILAAALRVAAERGGWISLTRAAVAREARCSDALVSVHFGTMTEFRRSVMRAAIRDRNMPVVFQGMAAGDRMALRAPQELKEAAVAAILAKG